MSYPLRLAFENLGPNGLLLESGETFLLVPTPFSPPGGPVTLRVSQLGANAVVQFDPNVRVSQLFARVMVPRLNPPIGAQIAFVDETTVNPLPPGVIASIYLNAVAPGNLVGAPMLNVGGVASIQLVPGQVYVATFSGVQAPPGPVTFTASAAAIVVPNYRSPVLSPAGYLLQQRELWPALWFGPDPNSEYAETWTAAALGALLGAMDLAEQQVLGSERLQSAIGAELESYAADYLGAGQFPRAPNESDISYAARLFTRLSSNLTTVPTLQALCQAYLAVIQPILIAEEIDLTSVYVFDQMTNPELAAVVGIAPPEFCILFGLPAPVSLANWVLGSSFLGNGTFLGSSPTYETIDPPTPVFAQIVNAVKAAGTVPVYAQPVST